MGQAESYPADNICKSMRFNDLLTDLQTEECKKYHGLVLLLLSDVVGVFRQQCKHQFRHEKWNCQDIRPPIFGVTQPFSTLRKRL